MFIYSSVDDSIASISNEKMTGSTVFKIFKKNL